MRFRIVTRLGISALAALVVCASALAISPCGSCTDGGDGASSCTISGNGGCSVTCRTGTNACCNVGSCTCCVPTQSPVASLAPLGAGQVVPVSAEEKSPTRGFSFAGNVTISTGPHWEFVYVTVAPPRSGQPLQAAFAVQFGDTGTLSLPQSISFEGQGQVVFSGSRLLVKPANSGGWLFEVSQSSGVVPSGVTVVDAVGLASYSMEGKGRFAPPTSHDEFVRQRMAAVACSAPQAPSASGR